MMVRRWWGGDVVGRFTAQTGWRERDFRGKRRQGRISLPTNTRAGGDQTGTPSARAGATERACDATRLERVGREGLRDRDALVS